MYGKYDRQIRLFGKEVQKKIHTLNACIIDNAKDNLISGEVLKNLVLLGVNNLAFNQRVLESYKHLVPHEINVINETVSYKIIKENTYQDSVFDFLIKIDEKDRKDIFEEIKAVSTITLCRSCYSFSFGELENTDCTNESSKIKDCLLGSIVTQEIIKKLQNLDYIKNYTLNV